MADQFMTVIGNQAPSTAGHHPKNTIRYTPFIVSFSIICGVLFFCGYIIFIIFMSLSRPIPDIPQVSVETLTLTNFNRSSNSFTSGIWEARIIVQNPDSKFTLYYDHMKVNMHSKSKLLFETSGVRPFVQRIKNETVVNATFTSFKAELCDLESINGDLKVFGMVIFNVKMKGRIRYETRHWWEKGMETKFDGKCPDLLVSGFANGNGGSLFGGSEPCRVGFIF